MTIFIFDIYGDYKMNINIYYGGRGLVDDPTILVINKIQEVLDELNVNVNRYNLYEMKNTITTLSQTVTEADGIILATTVEWVGMGGYMQTFLDSCWLYSDKSQILDKYMFPVVMARTYGEREVTLALNNSWEIIGGKIGPALSAYIDDTTDFEFNDNYKIIIEKYAENVYRTISQRIMQLPSSSQTIKNNMLKDTIKLTPQESEQLSNMLLMMHLLRHRSRILNRLQVYIRNSLMIRKMVEMIIILMFLEIILILQQDIRVHI